MNHLSNKELQMAYDYIVDTQSHVFITGKAGTGKTTFLHHLKKQSPKRMVIAAPTGVAAINARGVTLHSLFQLPFGPFIPSESRSTSHESTRYKLNSKKINLLKNLDILVIDEISMVRCDLLDQVDDVLRRYRHSKLPFGGVQLVMIGDLHQLAPIAKADDWNLLKEYYESCYFFSSKSLKATSFVTIELTQIFRQTDPAFIKILNNIRLGLLDSETNNALLQRYNPCFHPDPKDDYIRLSTHNSSVDTLNTTELDKIPSKKFEYMAEISGIFPEYNYPTSQLLHLKKGAQVMFVRNDSSDKKRFFNGKIGRVKSLDKNFITVSCPDSSEDIVVEQEVWENIKYSLNDATNEIDEEIIGTFSQFPLRAAWAITIHKSQGLTFSKVIIDAGASFSHGQVYVALSRCKTLEGIILTTKITQKSLHPDTAVLAFMNEIQRNNCLDPKILEAQRIKYSNDMIIECFSFTSLLSTFITMSNLLTVYRPTIATIRQDIINVSERFHHQLISITDENLKQERIKKGSVYFYQQLQEKIGTLIVKMHLPVENKELNKKLKRIAENLQLIYEEKLAVMKSCHDGFKLHSYLKAKSLPQKIDTIEEKKIQVNTKQQISTKEITYDLYKKGMSVAQIAKERELVQSTILGHLADYISLGKIEINDFMSEEKKIRIIDALKKFGGEKLITIKQELGDDVSYMDITMVKNFLRQGRN